MVRGVVAVGVIQGQAVGLEPGIEFLVVNEGYLGSGWLLICDAVFVGIDSDLVAVPDGLGVVIAIAGQIHPPYRLVVADDIAEVAAEALQCVPFGGVIKGGFPASGNGEPEPGAGVVFFEKYFSGGGYRIHNGHHAGGVARGWRS